MLKENDSMRHILMAAVVLAGTVMLGCNKSKSGGKTSDSTPSSATFDVKAPALATTIKQGDKQTVKLTLERGKDFKQAVSFKAEPPSGLKVDLEPTKIKAGDPETFTASVTVGKDAALGEHKVKVTATPDTGNAVSVEFKVTVEKKAD